MDVDSATPGSEIEGAKKMVEMAFLLAVSWTRWVATTVRPAEEYDFKEMIILYFLEVYQERGITQQGLVRMFQMSASSVYDMINSFQTKGWVEYASGDRKRGRSILVTDAGRKFLQKYFVWLTGAMGSLIRGTSGEELEACGLALNKLRPAVLKNLEYGAFGSVSEP